MELFWGKWITNIIESSRLNTHLILSSEEKEVIILFVKYQYKQQLVCPL